MHNQLTRIAIAESNTAPLGMGCWAIGGPFQEGNTALGWGEVDDRESIRAIRAALDQGITFFDTADLYGAGHSEYVLSRALCSRRSDAIITTKFGFCFDEQSREVTGQNLSPEYIKQACEASLRRLNTDYIDLYLLHVDSEDTGTIPDVIDTLEQLARQGKILSYGWSTDSVSNASLMLPKKLCDAIEYRMNLADPAPDMLSLCQQQSAVSLIRSPLAMGLLTGKRRQNASSISTSDIRSGQLDWLGYYQNGQINPAIARRFESVRDIVTSHGRTPAQGALAWLWALGEEILPIPGFRTTRQVTENAGALEKGPLTEDQVSEINQILQQPL